MATEAVDQASKESEKGKTSRGAASSRNGSALRRAAAGSALAAAAVTTVYVTRKAMKDNHEGDGQTASPDVPSSSKGESEGPSGESGEATTVSSRFEDFFTVLRTSGWDAANDMLVPFAANAARALGVFAAEKTPDLVRDTLLPKFVDGFTEARQKSKQS